MRKAATPGLGTPTRTTKVTRASVSPEKHANPSPLRRLKNAHANTSLGGEGPKLTVMES